LITYLTIAAVFVAVVQAAAAIVSILR